MLKNCISNSRERQTCDRSRSPNKMLSWCNSYQMQSLCSHMLLPVIFHSLSSYDPHLDITQAFEINHNIEKMKFDAISNYYEKFMTFSVGGLKLINSFHIMSSSFQRLVKTKWQNKFSKLRIYAKKNIERIGIWCPKGYYPYEWVNEMYKERLCRITTANSIVLITKSKNQ